jgi:hypothetical protein
MVSLSATFRRSTHVPHDAKCAPSEDYAGCGICRARRPRKNRNRPPRAKTRSHFRRPTRVAAAIVKPSNLPNQVNDQLRRWRSDWLVRHMAISRCAMTLSSFCRSRGQQEQRWPPRSKDSSGYGFPCPPPSKSTCPVRRRLIGKGCHPRLQRRL